MRKHWNLVACGVATLLILTVFYIANANYSKQLPQFSIKKTEGDEAFVKDMTIAAQYYYGMDGIELFQIDDSGTNYLRDESYFKRLEGFSRGPEIEAWQKEYRGFIRGKYEYDNYLTETEEKLTSASIISSSSFAWKFDTLELHVLDKATEKQHYFTMAIPEYTKYQHPDILYTYIEENEYTIIMEGEYNEGKGNKVDVNRYTFDIVEEELIEEERIYETTKNQSDQINEEIKLHTSDKDKGHFIIEKLVNHYKDIESKSGEVIDTAHTIETKDLIKYNVQTKEKEDVVLPKGLEDLTFIAFDDTTYYFTTDVSTTIEIIPYQFKEEQVMEAWEVEVPQPENMEWASYATIKDNKLYYLHDVYDDITLPKVFVIDLQKEQLAFAGEITTDEPIHNSDRYYFEELFIH